MKEKDAGRNPVGEKITKEKAAEGNFAAENTIEENAAEEKAAREKAAEEKTTEEVPTRKIEAARKTLQQMNLMDDFLMNQLIAHPIYGVRFSRIVLKIILRRQIGRLAVMPQREYPGDDTDLHGIRLDVYLDEEGSGIIDLEPDNNEKKKEALPKRARFYHAKIDAGSFASGLDYEALRDVAVIFITTYDPFGLGRMVYTVSNRCEEVPGMLYDDGAKSIYLYTKGNAGNCPEDLRKLLRYMEHSSYENAVSEELMEIHTMVTEMKRDRKVGLAYMKSYEIKRQMLEEGKKAGLEEGRKAGQKEERIRAEAEIARLKAGYEQERAGYEQERAEFERQKAGFNREKAQKDARIAELEAALRERGM